MAKKQQLERTHLSVILAAESIGVGEPIVLAWIASRELKAINISQGSIRPRWRIAKTDLAACLERRSNQQKGDSKPKRKPRRPQRQFV